MTLAYLINLLGEPTFSDVSDDGRILSWVEAEFYVQVLARNDTVAAWAVTTRKRWFRPKFFRRHIVSADGSTIEVKLGSTRFADLPGEPQAIEAWVGAHNMTYSECHYYGNPGNYLYYVYTLNESGWLPETSGLIDFLGAGRSIEFEAQGDEVEAFTHEASERRVRQTKFNTIGAIDWRPIPSPDLFRVASGANWHRVRLLARPRRRTIRDFFKIG